MKFLNAEFSMEWNTRILRVFAQAAYRPPGERHLTLPEGGC